MPLFGGDEQPEPAVVEGHPVVCQICHNRTFWQKRAQLHGGLATFFNMEWASPTAVCLVCSNCGHIHWFLPLESSS